jgi:hypothetical protein
MERRVRNKARPVIDGDDEFMLLGCLGPQSLLALGKVALLVVFFYALSSALGLWGE